MPHKGNGLYWLYFCILCNKNGIKWLRGDKCWPSLGPGPALVLQWTLQGPWNRWSRTLIKIQIRVNQKSRKCVFWPFLNRHQKKLFYSLFQNRPKYYESSKTEYSDHPSFINRLTPLFFFQANFRGPLVEKALQGPSMVQTDRFFYIGL